MQLDEDFLIHLDGSRYPCEIPAVPAVKLLNKCMSRRFKCEFQHVIEVCSNYKSRCKSCQLAHCTFRHFTHNLFFFEAAPKKFFEIIAVRSKNDFSRFLKLPVLQKRFHARFEMKLAGCIIEEFFPGWIAKINRQSGTDK